MKQYLRTLFSLGVIFIVIYFLYGALSKNWNNLDFSNYEFNIIYASLSFLFLIIFYLFSTLTWKFILQKLGVKINYKKCLKIKTLADLGRYIPGKVWYVLGRTHLSRKQGISNTKTIISLVIEHLFMLILGFALFLSLNLKKTMEIGISQFHLNLILLCGILVLVLFPRIFNRLVIIGAKIKDKEQKDNLKINISIKDNFNLLLRYLIYWLIIGISFMFVIKSIYPSFAFTGLLFFTGIFALSWGIGLLSFITPGGIGVREGIMTTLLMPYMPLSIAIGAPILFRLYSVIIEAVLSLLVLKIKD